MVGKGGTNHLYPLVRAILPGTFITSIVFIVRTTIALIAATFILAVATITKSHVSHNQFSFLNSST